MQDGNDRIAGRGHDNSSAEGREERGGENGPSQAIRQSGGLDHTHRQRGESLISMPAH
jgi:hypothetical protein